MSVRKEIIGGLITALEAVKSDSSYPITVKSVHEFDENYLTFDNHDVPAIFVNDTGSETLLVRHGSSYKKEASFFILGFVHADSKAGLRKNLNDTKSFIEQFIDSTSGSDIHASCQALEFVESESLYYQSQEEPNQMMGSVTISVSLRYFIASGAF